METIIPVDDEEHLCPVCLEEILPTDGQALTECCHNVFHLSCMILTYTQRDDNKTKCPMCRGNICKQLQLHTNHDQLSFYDDTIDFASNLSSPLPWLSESEPINSGSIQYNCENPQYGLTYNTFVCDGYTKLTINATEKITNVNSRYDMCFVIGGTIIINFIDNSHFYVMYYTNSHIIIRKLKLIHNIINPCGYINITDLAGSIIDIMSHINDSSINKKLVLNINYSNNYDLYRTIKNIDIDTMTEVTTNLVSVSS